MPFSILVSGASYCLTRLLFAGFSGTNLNNMTTTGMIADAILAIRDNAYYCGDYELVDGNYKIDLTVDHDLNVIFNRIEKRKSGNWRTVNSVPDGFDMEELIFFIKRFSLIKKIEIEEDEKREEDEVLNYYDPWRAGATTEKY